MDRLRTLRVRTPVDEEECALYRVLIAFYDQTGVLT
jgi:hypothetical protein